MGERRNAYEFLYKKSFRKGTIWKNWLIWEDTIKTDFTYVVWEVIDWVHLAQDRDQ